MEKEKKIELVCDYCNLPITENDYKCPKCGANCAEKIKKYQKQQEQLREAEKLKNAEKSKQLSSDVSRAFLVPLTFFLIIFVTFVVIFISFNAKRVNPVISEPVIVEEEGTSVNCSVTLDSYEFYSYVSDRFPDSYNTPKGYQKIAFHFTYENKRSTKHYISGSDVSLKADGYKVEDAKLEIGMFERAETGQEKYSSILSSYVEPNDTLKGYVGFLVPKSAKTLDFSFDGVKITIDNPAYAEE